MELVLDANILGEVCRGNKEAKKLLENVKEHNLKISKEILKEYKRLLTCKIPNAEMPIEGNGRFLKEWFTIVEKKWKKVKADAEIPICIERLIQSRDFGKKDVVYVQVALKMNNGILIAQEYHFRTAQVCLDSADIKLLDISAGLLELNK
ncbi:hypothetical protein A9239_03390 [Methanosarcina sp. A14]|uniref:hypothetical protein n=1 Tax=Methanosarcina TaxID=2207 RepID=UPI00064E73DB|nr:MULTISPECIES: hypothetical protein [Methanosarcina]OEC91193.1 hypothetical protein A9239_03390 [Methanosarcina sp. A14]